MSAIDIDDVLFARAAVAIEEARLLISKNRAWQAEIIDGVRRMVRRGRFYPRSLTLYSPLDFPQPVVRYIPFPQEDLDSTDGCEAS